jgi:hypothetical protein
MTDCNGFQRQNLLSLEKSKRISVRESLTIQSTFLTSKLRIILLQVVTDFIL